MTDFAHARRVMVDTQVRPSSISDRRLLTAMGQVPREQFVPASRRDLAYIDDVQRLEGSDGVRFLAAPAQFARLLNLAGISSADHVLDVGCANGYSTAVIALLAASVVGIDTDEGLVAEARKNLEALGYTNATVTAGALETAGRNHGPYDVIVIEGALAGTPDVYFSQLKDGGRLVAMIQAGPIAVANLYVKSGKDVAARTEFDGAMPPIGNRKATEEFVF